MDAIATAIEDNLCAYAAFFGASSLAELNDQPSLLWVISRIPTGSLGVPVENVCSLASF